MNRRARGPRFARLLPLLAAAAAALVTACASVPGTPVSQAESEAAVAAYRKARAEAFRPRRFKALFQGDAHQNVGAIAHGYLGVWWDGETLTWRTSAPLVGTASWGRLSRDGSSSAGGSPLKLGRDTADAIGAILGALDASPTGRVERRGDSKWVELTAGRAAMLDAAGRVTGLQLPDGDTVRFEPGEGLPKRIEAKAREGRAELELQSLAEWPADEPLPPMK